MKKLSLLIFAILILGCATETPVVEQPVIEEPEPVIEEPPPVKPVHHPLIAFGDVKHREVNVDPEPLNRGGFHFRFKEPFYDVWVSLKEKDGERLHWSPSGPDGWGERELLNIEDFRGHDPLEYDTEYELMITVKHFNCERTEIVIQFRTKPQKPVVGRPAPAIQERPPAVPLGERFRWDIIETHIVDSDVRRGDIDVDPEPLNANGIQFEFSRGFHEYEIDLRLKDGASLSWFPRGLVDNEDLGKRIKIMPGDGAALLDFDTEYEINISVLDLICRPEKFTIRFRTKPKP